MNEIDGHDVTMPDLALVLHQHRRCHQHRRRFPVLESKDYPPQKYRYAELNV